MNELIKSLAEKSISESMSDIKNDIQNLHIELIKQSIAQQNALMQIVNSLPDSYQRLAQENQSLREELERLKLRLN